MDAMDAKGTTDASASRSMVDWPVIRRYHGVALRQVAMPFGGIGTGSISLGGRGQLTDWELFNRPAKGFDPQ